MSCVSFTLVTLLWCVCYVHSDRDTRDMASDWSSSSHVTRRCFYSNLTLFSCAQCLCLVFVCSFLIYYLVSIIILFSIFFFFPPVQCHLRRPGRVNNHYLCNVLKYYNKYIAFPPLICIVHVM